MGVFSPSPVFFRLIVIICRQLSFSIEQQTNPPFDLPHSINGSYRIISAYLGGLNSCLAFLVLSLNACAVLSDLFLEI